MSHVTTPIIVTITDDSHNGRPPVAALTTIFSPQPSCFTPTVEQYDYRCFPSGMSNYQNKLYGNFFSPGICPDGYTVACGVPTTAPTYHYSEVPLEPEETARSCCPSSYSCQGYVTTGQALAQWPWNQYCISGTVRATAIQVRWKATDLPNLETDPLVPGKRNSAPATSSTGHSASSPAPNLPKSNTGLSAGAKIGIGIGGAGLFIAILLGAVLLWRRAHKRKKPKNDTPPAQVVAPDDGNELPEVAIEGKTSYTAVEAPPGTPYSMISEVSGTPVQPWNLVEAPTPWTPAELPVPHPVQRY